MQHIITSYPEYGRFARPVEDASDTLTVDMAVTLIKIKDYAEKGYHTGYGTLSIAGWLMIVSSHMLQTLLF